MNPDWQDRLIHGLEPRLSEHDPRPSISAYHDMPYAIFVTTTPRASSLFRKELDLLHPPADQDKRVTTVLARLPQATQSRRRPAPT